MSKHSKQSPSVNIISEGTTLKGDISAKADIRVAGIIEGEATSKGKLIITVSGNIKGNVTTQEADIAGKVEGQVKVSDKLTLRENAIIDGDIYVKTLIVEEGAQINGSCRMGSGSDSLQGNEDADFAKIPK
ncbi:polymer-forming cytoskeletal protein [Gracilimonas sp.]|uniref:bactofilin family protein n=1 Tax=Gracilimonas sp. TaxID=1974203 RepID=UPI0028712232|nr:polymer-forming cytoskeletal protein [Gracilimonas sp.]